MNRSRARTPTSATQTAQDQGAQTRGGAGRSAAGGGKGPRRHNLPMRFKPSALNLAKQDNPDVDPAATLHDRTQRELKDGSQFTDSERLYLVVHKLKSNGYSRQRVVEIVEGAFFDVGRPANGRDRLETVTLVGTEVHITFKSPGGYAFNGGKILPMICGAPTVYPGLDTNARGSVVRDYKATSELPRGGSWLVRNAALVAAGFLLEETGRPFADMSASVRRTDPNYKQALADYEAVLAADYLIRAPAAVTTQVGAQGDRSPQELLQAVITSALAYANPNLYATGHGAMETQDEAVIEMVMKTYGYDVNVDTDNPAASSIV